MQFSIFAAAILLVAMLIHVASSPARGGDADSSGYDAVVRQVEGQRTWDIAPDYWIEVKSIVRDGWERHGLIFGYGNNDAECQKAIARLKAVKHTARLPLRAGQLTRHATQGPVDGRCPLR